MVKKIDGFIPAISSSQGSRTLACVVILPRGSRRSAREPWKLVYSPKKIDGFIPAIFLKPGVSNPRLRCNSSAGLAAIRSRALETRLLRLPQPEPPPDRRRKERGVESVEVQSRRAALQEPRTQIGHDVETERADRRRVVAVALELAADPAWNLRSAGIGEARELGKAADRHDPGHDRYADS